MKPRRKARALATLGVCLGWCSTASTVIWGSWWPVVLLNMTVWGLTCAIAGVTWWMTREAAP